MSRLTDAIDANRRGEAVPPRTQTPKNNAMGTGSREERATSRAPSPVPSASPKANPTGQSRLEQAIDASRRGETVRPGTYTPPKAIVPNRYYRPAAVGTEPAQSQKPTEKPRKATLYDMTIGSIKRGYDNAVYGRELYKDMTGQENQADEYAQKMAGDEYNFEAGGFLSRALSGGMELLGQQVRQWTDPLSVGLAGTAATGAAIAGQAGPQVLVPEEVITVPGAFLAGLQVGSTKANFEIEAGHAYKEMLDNGISEETASKIATGVGIGNAALEFVQLDELAKSFKILDKIGADDSIIGAVKRELTRRGVDIAKETAQEVAQEGVTIAGTQIGSKIDTGKWAYDSGDVLGRLGDTAASSALSFGTLNVPGGAYNVYQQTSGKDTQNAGGKSAEDIGATFQEMGDDVVLATIQEGLASDPSTRSYQLAQQLQQKLDAGETITNAELGHLYQANVQAIDAEENSDDLLLRAADEAARKGGVTNSTATDILGNPSAVRTLAQDAGLSLADDMSKAQRRKAVKTAVETLASRNTATMESSVETNMEQAAPSPAAPQSVPVQQRPMAAQAYDIRRVQSAAASLGERGAKALRTAYDGSVSADTFYAGFASYYEAGVSGMDMGKVRSEYGAQLSAAQKYAAYVAGRNDAELSLQRERQAAPYAKSAGNDSGLVYDDFVRQAVESGRVMNDVNGETRVYLTAETAAKINGVAKSLGVRVQFVDSVRGGTANAQISGSTVLVERNNPNPVMAIVGHEMTHRMQELAPKEYRAFRDFVAQEEQSGIQRRIDAYAAQGVELTYEQAMDEVAADYAGRMIDDGKVLDDFIEKYRDDRTLLEKVRDAIRAIVRKLTGAEKKQAQTAEGKLTAALEAAAKQAENLETNKNAAQTDGETKFSIKRTSQMTLAQQLKMFYDGKMASSDAFYFGETPAALNIAGLDALPLAFTVSDFRKSSKGKHNVPRRVWKNLHSSLETALFSFRQGDRIGIMTGDIDGDGKPLLVGIERNVSMDRTPVNAIRSVYGLDNPGPWLQNQIKAGKELVLLDREKANAFLQTYGAYSASVGDGIRSMGESVTQNGTEVKTKFSLKAPVEETKNLIALHNLTEEKLWGDLRLGGFPMPSIAVTRIDVPHTNFGDITLVMDKRSIDPKANRKNTVYSADAWTPTFPQVEYAADPAAERRISGRLRELSGKVDEMFKQDLYRITYDMEDLLNRYGGEEELLRQVMDNYGLKAAYLEDAGHHVSAATVQREADKGYSQDRVEKYRAIVETLGTDDPDEIGHIPLKELRDRYEDELEAAFPGMTKSTFRLSGIIRQVQAYLQDQGGEPVYETVTDATATRRAIDDALDRVGYERWVRELYSGVQADSGIYNNKERFTPAGNRRTFRQTHYPVTLENIVKAMKGQNGGNTKNVSGFYGVKSLRAGTAKRFKSIADMHKLEGRLQNLTEEQTKAIHDELDRRLMDITEALAEKSPNGKGSFDYYLADSIGNMLVEIADGEVYTIDAIMGKFNGEYGFHIGNELAAQVRDLLFDVSQMPVNIFEAKPERAVGFDEVLAAVLPDDASGELRDALSGRGVNVLTYKAGDDADRIAKVNGVEGARFSLKTVPPVKPTSDDWKPGATFDEVKAAHPTLFALDADEADTRNPTQISGTVKSYRKIYDALQAENFDGAILDASSGLGYGTRAGREEYGFDVDDIEPFPDAKYQPNYTDYSTLDKTYDVIISNAVLNVMPQDLRDAMVVKIGEMLNPGGRAFINVRGTDVKNAGSKVAINDNLMEYFISNTGSYQKGFTSKELVSYLKDALGDGFTVEPTRKFGAVSAIVTRYATDRYSLKAGTEGKSAAALQEENELLREQMKDYIDLQRRNGKLQESRDYWQGQTRRTKRVTTDKKAVSRAARELIRSYGADLDAGDITQDLQSLYDYLASGYDGKDELTYTEARRRAEAIAEKLVGNAVAVDETYEQYSDLRAYLRSTTLSLSEEDSRDIPDYGDWRKHQMGRMVIRKGHTNIDQVYQEMSELWPEFFDEQRENNPVDQLLRIAEVMDGIYNVEEYNPFGPYMQQAITGAANEIMERFFDLPQTRATFADQQARKLDDAKAKGRERVQKVREQNAARLAELRRQNRERTAKAVERERTRRVEQIGKLKQRHREKDAEGRERRSARELRAKIMRHASALSQKLLRPSDKQHIPENLRQAVAAMLESINLESAYTTDPNTGKRVKDGSGTPTKRTEAFRALKEQYEAIRDGKTDFTGVLDPELVDNLAELIKAKDTPLSDMSTAQLATVWNTLKAVEASVSSANKLFHKGRFSGVEELVYSIQDSSRGKRAKNNYGGNGLGKVSGFGDQLLNVDMLNPLTFLHLFGRGGDALYHELQEARDRKTEIMERTAEMVQDVIGKADISAMQEKTHTFQVSGGEITLSTAQLMSLYELTKREQAQDHIYKGGLRPTEQKRASNLLGKLENPPDGVKVDPGDVSRMLSALTEQETKIADGLQAIMQGYLADEGNQESMKVFGYRKFTEEHYFPISSDPNHVQSKIGDILEGGVKRPVSVAEWGSAKGTTKGANNGLLLGDIFDVFAQHAVDMSTYASHLGALEDVNRVRNFTFRNEEGDRTGQMKSIIQRVAGQHGNAYLDKLLQDISRGTAKGGVTGLSRLTANYKAASVGLNLRVALQQPTSYARTLAVMDGKYLADPRVMKMGGWEKALKYAPIARWKDWGNFEVNQGRQFQDILFGTDSKLERARNASMKLASAMDSLTWGRIWNACELETADLRRDLTRGSEVFYRAVAQRFTDVVDQTQVVDNVLGRSQFMRSGDNLAKMASSYMGEPTQSYNLFYRAYRDAVQEQNPTKRRQAAKRMGRAAGALVFSMFLNAVAQSLWDAVRDDDDRDEKYWERVLGHILPNFAQNVNPMGMVPYLRDVLSILQGYDVERMDLAAVTGLVQAARGMQKALNGEGRYTVIGAGANLVAELSRVVGLPVPTVKRDVLAIARSMGIETGDWYFQYQIERAINSLGYSGNRKEFYDIAFGALSAGELDVYQQITADMMAGGVKASSIEAAMRDRLEAAQTEDPAFTLTQRAKDLIGTSERYGHEEKNQAGFGAGDLDPAAYARYNAQRAETYRTWANELEQSAGFRRMNDAGKDKALDAAEKLAKHLALIEHSGGQVVESDLSQWERWATNGEAWGVDPTEAILFKAAYDMSESDKDKAGKTISGSKKENTLEAAAELLPGLTDEELEYLMSNFWKPEDRELSEMRERGFMP